jgi:hypothetical protein
MTIRLSSANQMVSVSGWLTSDAVSGLFSATHVGMRKRKAALPVRTSGTFLMASLVFDYEAALVLVGIHWY